MKKIVLLTDYSKASRNAVFYTVRLYHEIPCEIRVVHSYELLPDSTGIMDEEIAKIAATGMEEFLLELKQDLVGDSHSFEGLTFAGNLSLTVSELYEKDPFDVLVVGASGSGNSVRLGSVATQMIRAAPCPVLVVPVQTDVKRIVKIVVVTDYSNFSSPDVFAPVKELMAEGQKELVFLSILKKDESPEEVDSHRQSLLNAYFEWYKPLHYYMKDGSTLGGIEDYLETHKTDLLVTIAHHTSLWDILLNRSTSRILAYQAEVPLLVLQEGTSGDSDVPGTMDLNVIL